MHQMRLKTWGGLAASMLVCGAGCAPPPAVAPAIRQHRTAPLPLPAVSVATVLPAPQARPLTFMGLVAPNPTVDVTPPVSGRILYLGPSIGGEVTRGEVLVRIDVGALDNELHQTRLALAHARARFARPLTAAADSAGLAVAAAELGSARAALGRARADAVVRQNTASVAVADAASRLETAHTTAAAAAAGVATAASQLQDAQAKLDKTTSYYQQGFVAARDVDRDREAVAAAQSKLDAAHANQSAADAALKEAESANIAASRTATPDGGSTPAPVTASEARVRRAEAAYTAALARQATAQSTTVQRATEQSLESKVQMLQSQVDAAVLIAPINGFVSARAASPGGMAAAGLPLYVLAVSRTPILTVDVPVTASRGISPGADAFVLPGSAAAPAHATVLSIAPSGRGLHDRTEVEIALDTPSGALKAGQTATVEFPPALQSRGVLVPEGAVRRASGGHAIVYVVDSGGSVTAEAVTLGVSGASQAEITAGLRPGARVVVDAVMALRDGERVRAVSAAPRTQ